jgi:hypothetical protein
MDLSVPKQSFLLHLKTPNYVKNDTKLSKRYQNQYQKHKNHFKTKLMTKISKHIGFGAYLVYMINLLAKPVQSYTNQ